MLKKLLGREEAIEGWQRVQHKRRVYRWFLYPFFRVCMREKQCKKNWFIRTTLSRMQILLRHGAAVRKDKNSESTIQSMKKYVDESFIEKYLEYRAYIR
jgi:hypothetical protein